MAFCSYSSETLISNSVTISNNFIAEFLPILPEHCVKVYLFGLYHCSNATSLDNDLDSFARILNMTKEDIVSCYQYLKELNLVQIINTEPIQIKYLPVSKASTSLMKFNKDKYKEFNEHLLELVKGRVVSTTEFNEFYYTMESLHIEPKAMIKIVEYCTHIKGSNVGYKYILTVAKNWAYEGYTTVEKIEEKLLQQQAVDSDLSLVLKALGVKKGVNIEDYELYLQWTNDMGYSLDVILHLAKIAKKKSGGISRLDHLLNKFYSLKLQSVKEIDEFLAQETEFYEMAKVVCKNIGVRYDNLENVVETYITKWVQLGFDFESMAFISQHCFSVNVRTLSGVDGVVAKFYKLGLTSVESIESHLLVQKMQDDKVAEILNKLGIVRNVNMYDREYYNTWLYSWQISEELLNYAIEKSADKVQPMQFLNRLLSLYYNKGIKTKADAEKENVEFLNNSFVTSKKEPKENKKSSKKVEYSKEQLQSLITTLEEVEI